MKRLLTLLVLLSIAVTGVQAQSPTPVPTPAPSETAPASEPPRPEPARPEPARPEPARPEPVRPEVVRPEVARPPAAAVPSTAAPANAPASVTPSVSPAEAQRLVDLLNDPKKRADFTATLAAIAKSLPQPQPQPAAAAPEAATLAIPLAPDSLGAELLVSGSSLLGRISDRFNSFLTDLRAIPPMGGWIIMMASDPLGRKLLLDTAWRLAVTFAAGLAVEGAVRWLLRRPIAALGRGGSLRGPRRDLSDAGAPPLAPGQIEAPETDPNDDLPDAAGGLVEDGQSRAEIGAIEPPERRRSALLIRMQRLPRILLRLLITLIPVVCFVVVSHLVVTTTVGEIYLTRLTLLAVIDAYAVCRIVVCVASAFLSPDAPGWRLLPVTNETAISGVRWIRLLAVIAIFGYALAEAGLLLGMSRATHEALLKTDGLVLTVLAVVIVLRNRGAVAAMIRARPGQTGQMVRWRKRLAASWHVIAVLYLAGLWLVWAIDVPDGFRRLLNFFVVTIAVAMVARLLRTLLLGLLERQMERAEAESLRPGLAARMRFYHPVLNVLIHFVVFCAAVVVLMQLWGFGSVEWLATNLLAQRMVSALTTIGITIAMAVGVWETSNGAVERHLSRLQRDAQTARSARLRTLLPMLRTALLITILVVIGLIILSEIGVNIAPLLAGAGVLGIAIGFGSQKLVQDIITGLFLLLENTMQVGDVVSLGGLQGTVEYLSIRTIRLRSEDGSVHVIPFSAVTTVTNMTRDFSHAVIEAQVAYKDDYDAVVAVLRAIVTEMRTEPRWQGEIRDELEVLGLQRFADSAVVIKCRIRCGPFGRWAVGREFNRRMKMRFDEAGIEIPFPHQQMIIEDQRTPHPLAPATAAPPEALPSHVPTPAPAGN
jgi:small-conductance mechanosensitive channel